MGDAAKRTARVNRRGDGDPLGALIYLSADDLRAVGVDPEEAEAVAVRVDSGRLRLEALEGEVVTQ